MFIWSPKVLPALAAFVLVWAMSLFGFASREDRTASRRLALQLVLDGVTVGSLSGILWGVEALARALVREPAGRFGDAAAMGQAPSSLRVEDEACKTQGA